MEILSSPAQHSAIVSRTLEYIVRQIDNYMVYCVDEDVIGCCEIIQYADGSAAEIASLAVDKSYRNQGIGSEMVREGVLEMRSADFRLVFALSVTVSHIFTQCGFEQISPEELLEEKRKKRIPGINRVRTQTGLVSNSYSGSTITSTRLLRLL